MQKFVLTALSALSAVVLFPLFVSASVVEWTFPRLGGCHEGLAFSDGRTGVLVWGGGDEIRLTVGRGDLWDHRGGYDWTPAQSYTNIVDAVLSGDTNRLVSLFRKETPNRGGTAEMIRPLTLTKVRAVFFDNFAQGESLWSLPNC